jgi:membrane-bound serine protease (ClpP class)
MKSITKFILIILDELLIGCFIIYLLFSYTADLWIFVLVAVMLIIVIIFIAYIFLPHLKNPVTGIEGMVGMRGVVIKPLNPNGMVKIRGEIWNAKSLNSMVDKGEKIIVEKVNNLSLLVKKVHKDE